LLLTTYREPEMRRRSSVLGEIARAARTIGLRGLKSEEVKQYVLINSAAAPSEAIIARLRETSEGNPFFLEELIATLRGSGELDSRDDVVSSIRLPDSLREAIRRRIEPLASEVQELLELAAVTGRDFTLQTLAAAAGSPPDTLLRQLSPALAAGLVHEVAAL